MKIKQKKTILSTLGGVTASSFVISSVAIQPVGNIKQALNTFDESKASNVIQSSALAEQGVLTTPHIAKAKAQEEYVDISTSSVISNSFPAYVAPGHQSVGQDSEGNDYDLIQQEQMVSRDITFNDGTEYTEVNGFVDDEGTYYDELPANASVGVENSPAVGNGDGQLYTKYTSRDNMTVNFYSNPNVGQVHGKVNTQSVNGPNIIYDQSDYTWHSVDTGTTSGKVGDGSGGYWTHLKSAASSWPAIGYNPWHGNYGYWNNSARYQYITWLWDYNFSSTSWFYAASYLTNVMGYNRAIKLHNYLWGGYRSAWNRSMFINYFYYAQIVYGNAFFADNLYCYIYRPAIYGAWFGQSKQLNTLKLSWMNVDTYSDKATMNGLISTNNSNRYPNGDGSGDYYNGSADDDWRYYGPVFYSSYPTSYSGTSTVYGDATVSSSYSSSGSDVWDSTGTHYDGLPINAEKEAETFKWNNEGTDDQPGIGDESGKYYYQGTRAASGTQDFRSGTIFTEDSMDSDWEPDTTNFPAVGDGSGRTYERAVYYYDSTGTRVHTLPSGNWEYSDTSGLLFNTDTHDGTFNTTEDRQSGVGTAQVLNWIQANQATLSIHDGFNKNGLGVEWVITETDTQQKKVIIAVQAAMTLISGVTTNSALQTALSNLQLVIDISDTDKDAIATYANTISTSSVTHKLREGSKGTVDFFGMSREIFGTEDDINTINDFFDGTLLQDFFGVSTNLTTVKVEKTSGVIDYVYYERVGDTVAEQQLASQSASNTLPLEDVLLSDELIGYYTLDDWAQTLSNRATLSDVRYTDFDYDKSQLTIEAVIHIGDKPSFIREIVTFNNSYMDQIMRELALHEFIGSDTMLAEQPLLTSAQYTSGSQTEVESGLASFGLKDEFIAKFPEETKLVDIIQVSPPTEEQTDVRYQFVIEYEGHQRTYDQTFTFDKTRSQKYVEDAAASISNVSTTVSLYDRTILDLTSRVDTFQPFDDFLVADGNTHARMSFSNVQLVGGGDIDRDATAMDFTVDITMGTFTLQDHPLTLTLNHSVNTELINALTGDEVVATSPGIVSIVDEFDATLPEWEESSWWTIQSSWLKMIDIAGIAIVGNFIKIDERHFSVDLEVSIGNEKKIVNVTQKVGFNLNFAADLNESTTGISDPDTLEQFREYMVRFDELSSVYYIGNFEHGFIATAALESELLQAWEASISTIAGDAVLRAVSITDINAVTKYDREISFSITLEDSFGNTRVFDKSTQLSISPVAKQFSDATASMISTTQNLAGQLSDSVMLQMMDISHYTWLESDLDLLDTIRVVSVTNTGRTAHVTFELGYSGHLGDDSKQVSIDYVFDRRGDKDIALAEYGLGYIESQLSAYYDINNVDAAGNNWKNVEQSVLENLIKSAAQSQLRDDMESEIIALHGSIYPNVWTTQANLQTAIDDITTTDIMTLLQAEILAGGTTRATFITNELIEIRNNEMEDLILLDLASNWKLNSAADALNEVLKYNSSFNIKDFYLSDVGTHVSNSNFDTDIALEIAQDTLKSHVIASALQGVSISAEVAYSNAVTAAIELDYESEYVNNANGSWVNIDAFIDAIALSTSQILVDQQVAAASGTIGSTTHYDDRSINDLVKDLTLFTDEEIKIVAFDVENGAALDRDASSFNIEVYMTFGSVVNQKHVFTLDLDKSVNQAILDQIQSSDIAIKDFLVKELAQELEVEHYDTWDKFALSSEHVLESDNLQGSIDTSSFTVVGDTTTSPVFTLDFTLTIGNTSITINSEQRIGMRVIFDLSQVDPTDTVLLEYLRGYDVAERVDYHGTWVHPHELLDDLETDPSAVDNVLTLYSGLVASGVRITDIYVHNKDNISEFTNTLTLKIVAVDDNQFTKVFDKVITFSMTTAEWAFEEFTESSIELANPDLTNGMLTDAIKANILGQKTGYTISDHYNPVQIDDPIVKHLGKTATVSWRVWYSDGQPGGSSNSKIIEIDYVFASRGSKDAALLNFGLGYADDASGINVDWTNVDGTNDWTNVEQNVLDELVRGLAETEIRQEFEDSVLADASAYATNVWSSLSELQAEIEKQTEVSIVAQLAKDIAGNVTTREAFLASTKLTIQRDKIEDNILSTMQSRWNQTSVESLLNLVSSLNSIIDVKDYYESDMHNVVTSSTYVLDISRQMEIDTVRNSVSAHIVVGLDPSDARYTIYNDVMNSKIDATYDTEQATHFTDVSSLIKTIADSISQEAINDLLTSINSEITGRIDEDTRVLEDIYRDLDAFDQAGILHSNLSVAGGNPLDYDLLAIPLTIDLIWGSVTNIDTSLTMNLNKTVSQAIIDEIQFDEIGLIDPRLAPTADQVVAADLTYDMFAIFSRHVLGTDAVTLSIDTTTFKADPIEPRQFSMDVTITIGAETRVINIFASVGFDINLDWQSIDYDTATPAEQDLINFMNSYDFQKETEFTGLHANPWQLRDEANLSDQFSPSRNLVAARGAFVNVAIKNPSSITKYDKSLWVIITVEDKLGVTYDFEKEIELQESYLETLTKNTNDSHFDIVSTIHLSNMLTDQTITTLSSLSAYDVDSLLNEYDDIELLTLQQSGKTATATFRVSYDNGTGHSGSKIITKSFTFASRGDNTLAVDNFGLGYSNSILDIDWDVVDSFGNDWTNVEQDVLDQLVRTAAFDRVRADTRLNISLYSSGYVDNVFGSITALDTAILNYGSNTELTELQSKITNNIMTRTEWIDETSTFLKTSNVERMILEALTSEWRVINTDTALEKANTFDPSFDITSYYSDIDTLVLNATFDTDQARQIGYDVFSPVTRDLMDIFHSTNDTARDIQYDNVHASMFEAKYDENLNGAWTGLTDFSKLISDSISRQFIDDQIAQLNVSATGYPTIAGSVNENTRMLNDVYKDFSSLDSQYIDVSNIRLTSGGTTLGGDLGQEHILAGISFGSVVVDDLTFTLEFDQTINFAIMEAILADDIRMTEYRLEGDGTGANGGLTTADIDGADILAWMFRPLSSHLRASDSIEVTLDTANPYEALDQSVDPYLRRYTIGITLTLGNETRDYVISERIGQMVVFGDIDSSRWEELEIIDADDEVDFIFYNDSYPYVNAISYSENFDHVLDIQSANEDAWKAALAPSLYLEGGGLSIAGVQLKDNGTYTKYDKEFTFILTLEDSWGDQKVFEKTITLANSAVEHALLSVSESSFRFDEHDNTLAILTDDTLQNILTAQSSYFIDSSISQYLDISNPIVQYQGKTATIGFQVSFDNGAGYSDSKVIQIDVVFASRGSKDEAVINYGLDYTDDRLAINWSSVDSLANDWTNVEQEVLDNLVKASSQALMRIDVSDTINSASTSYITNVWEGQLELSNDIAEETTFTLLADLQTQITAGTLNRNQFITQLVEVLKETQIEILLFENLASLLRLTDENDVTSRAVANKADFDIKDYYAANKDGIIGSSSFVDTVSYQAIEDIYRGDIDSSMLASADDKDKQKVTDAINKFANEKIREVFALNVWTNDSTIVSHTSHLISAQAIEDAFNFVGSSVSGTITRDTRNINDVDIDWQPLQYEGLYLSNIVLSGSTNGDFIDRDATTLPSSISVTFGTIIDSSYLIDVNINETLNQAILGSLTSSSIVLRNAKFYATTEFMLEKMEEDTASGGSGTITNAAYFESAVDFLGRDDADIALDPNNTLKEDPSSARQFTIGLIITAGVETLHLEVAIQVGESIDFSLPEFSDGGTFDFNPYFLLTSTTVDNPYDLYQLGNSAIDHIGVDTYLSASNVSLTNIVISGNTNVDIFTREFYATFTLRDERGNTRTFVDQAIVIPGSINKAESIMSEVSNSDIWLDDSSMLTGQLTDEMLSTTLLDLSTYGYGNDVDLLNELQVKEVTHLGKFATVTFIVGYDDGLGNVDQVEYTYTYEFAYRADVPYSLNYYGLGLTVDQLNINFTADQESGNVEQDIIDDIVIAALQDYLFADFSAYLKTFADAGIMTQQEVDDDITAYLDLARIDSIAADGEILGREDTFTKYKTEITNQTVAKSYDAIAVSFLKAADWSEVSTEYPALTTNVEQAVADAIFANTFDAEDIQSILGYELALEVAPRVETIIQNGEGSLEAWLLTIIGSEKPGFLWMVHRSVAHQLSTGFNDAPKLSASTSGIHINEQSTNGWFIDEISHLTSFADMDDYIIHLSTKLARLEVPAEITDAHLAAARASLKADIAADLKDIIDEGILSMDDIDKFLDVLLFVQEDHPQGFPFANYDAVFSPESYYSNNSDQTIIDQLTHSGELRAKDAGFRNTLSLLVKTAIYIEASGADLVVLSNSANFIVSTTMDEYRDLHAHYTFMLMNNVYEVAYQEYQQIVSGNFASSLEVFLDSYVSKMDVYLSGLEGIEYDDQIVLDTRTEFIALRVDQIRNKPDIQGMIDEMITGIGLSASSLDDSPYKDLLKFTITEGELRAHLFDEAMEQILAPGGTLDQVIEVLDPKPTQSEITQAVELLNNMMSEEYPANEVKLDITIKAAFLFAQLDDEYYEKIIEYYNGIFAGQTPEWTPIATVAEAREHIAPLADRIFLELYNETLDFEQARDEIDLAQRDVAVELAWAKYAQAFVEMFEVRKEEQGVGRLTVEEMEEYVIKKISGYQSLEEYITLNFADIDRDQSVTGVPLTSDIAVYVDAIMLDMIDYAQERYETFLNDVADAASLTVEEVLANSTIADEVVLIKLGETSSIGGTSTEIKGLRSQIGKYVFKLMIEESVKPDPGQNINGWLIPFAALITKTDDYSKITEIIQDRIDSDDYENGSFENWGFEGIADIMNALIDNNTEQETYNAETGKILMDKFVRANDSTSNAWSTTMWLGPVPLRMTYGVNGDIASMQTILMDREDPETIKSIALSTKYNQKEMTLRLGMTDGTTVYVRYVEDADTHINVILQRINTDGTWATSEMYREADVSQSIARKTYRIFRDENLDSFEGLESDFESGMINIFGENIQANNAKTNQSTSTNSTIEHVWGTNPTVDSSMNLGGVDSAPAVVTKDDEGNTHIQMHMKDFKVKNTSVAITATITAGGFTLMWLIWTFLSGLGTVGLSGLSTGVIIAGRKNRKRRFINENPQYDGASTSKVLRLRKLLKQEQEAIATYDIARETDYGSVYELQALTKIKDKIAILEPLVLSESEVSKFQRGFSKDLRSMKSDSLTIDNVERAATISMALRERTRSANVATGGKYVENATQELRIRENIKMKKALPKASHLEDVTQKAAPKFKKIKLQPNGLTVREIETGLKKIKQVKANVTIPDPVHPRNGVDFKQFESLGLQVESVRFKLSKINKNSREQTIVILFSSKEKNISKDLKVIYPESINENIIRNFGRYNLDTTGLARFDSTLDPSFKERKLTGIFKTSAPNATLTFVKGSLKILSETTFSGKLKVNVGTHSAIIPFQGNL